VITFNGHNLFDSAPASVTPGHVELRASEQASPGALGSTLTAWGRKARSIAQAGELVSDDLKGLALLVDRIDDMIDGRAYLLIDEHETAWPNCVIQIFEPGKVRAFGPRIGLSYRIVYLQVQP